MREREMKKKKKVLRECIVVTYKRTVQRKAVESQIGEGYVYVSSYIIGS
jgi:hypothetical protein